MPLVKVCWREDTPCEMEVTASDQRQELLARIYHAKEPEVPFLPEELLGDNRVSIDTDLRLFWRGKQVEQFSAKALEEELVQKQIVLL